MSFGYSCQDIIQAIQIAKTILETWFDEYKRAGKPEGSARTCEKGAPVADLVFAL